MFSKMQEETRHAEAETKESLEASMSGAWPNVSGGGVSQWL